jgi:Phosphorylated adapter RNA export protein, RNA-binding domain
MNQNKPQDETWALAKEIGNQLGETEHGPRMQIATILRYCGQEFAQELLKDTLEAEAQGGIMLPDQSRRRTPGGVFFYLARERMEPEIRRQVFYGRGPKKKRRSVTTSSLPAEPDRPVFIWDERRTVIEALLGEKGEVNTVKVTLIGRPGKIELRQDLMITTMSHIAKGGTFPKGVPALPSTPTIYTVYISLKQWRKVEEAIANPEDVLIVEGMCAFDPALKVVAVFATNVTTKMMDAKRREEQKAAAGTENKPDGSVPKKKPAAPKTPQKGAAKAAPVETFTVPTGMPGSEAQKLSGLYASAALFRQKIAAIQAKPADQQSGLEMTQKLLKGVEDQIAALEKKYP